MFTTTQLLEYLNNNASRIDFVETERGQLTLRGLRGEDGICAALTLMEEASRIRGTRVFRYVFDATHSVTITLGDSPSPNHASFFSPSFGAPWVLHRWQKTPTQSWRDVTHLPVGAYWPDVRADVRTEEIVGEKREDSSYSSAEASPAP